MTYKLKTQEDIVSYFRENDLFDKIKAGLTGKDAEGQTVRDTIRGFLDIAVMVESPEVEIGPDLGYGAVVESIFDQFANVLGNNPAHLVDLSQEPNVSVLPVSKDSENIIIHFNGHFHKVSADYESEDAITYDIDRGLYLPSEEFDPAFRSYLERMEKAGDEFKEVIIPREGWNDLAGCMELIIMFPYSVIGTEGHCHAEIYPDGDRRRNADGLTLVDYDGVMKRTQAVELTEELCESYGAHYGDYVGADSYKTVRKQRHQEVYEGFAKLSYFGKQWDGFEIVDENAAHETYNVHVLVEENHVYAYDLKIVASSASAARAKVEDMEEEDWIKLAGTGEVHEKTIEGKQIVEVKKIDLDDPGPAYDFAPVDKETSNEMAKEIGENIAMTVEAASSGDLRGKFTTPQEAIRQRAIDKGYTPADEHDDLDDEPTAPGEVVVRNYILITVEENIVTDRTPVSQTPSDANMMLADIRKTGEEGESFALLQVMEDGTLVNTENGMQVIIGNATTEGDDTQSYNEFPVGDAPSKG